MPIRVRETESLSYRRPKFSDSRGDFGAILFPLDLDKPAFAQASEPCPLAFREPSRAGLDSLDHRPVVDLAAQVFEHLAIADRLACREPERFPLRRQPADLVDQTRLDHRLDPGFDSLVLFGSGALEDEDPALAGWGARLELHLLVADRLAGLAVDFERADQSPRVVGVNLRGGQRVDLLKAVVEYPRRQGGGLLFDLTPQRPVGGGPLEEPTEQALQIERSPADEQDLAATRTDLLGGSPGGSEVLGDAEFVAGVHEVDQVVRHPLAIGGAWFGGADIHAAIDGHRVERQDLGPQSPRPQTPRPQSPSTQTLGQGDAHPGFSHGGGPGEEPAVFAKEGIGQQGDSVLAGAIPTKNVANKNNPPSGVGPLGLQGPLGGGTKTRMVNHACLIYNGVVLLSYYRFFANPWKDGPRPVPRPLDQLESTIAERKSAENATSSYTARLLAGGVPKIGEKVLEEAGEVVEAAGEPGEAGRAHTIAEAGDVLYHLLVLLAARDITLSEVEGELARRFGMSGLDEKASR